MLVPSTPSPRLPLVMSAVLGALCLGCPNPQTYGTPRTLDAGTVQHVLAVEAFGLGDRHAGPDGMSRRTSVWPTLPTYGMRVGVAQTVDVGVRLVNSTSLAADVKLNPVRGRLDLAIAPGIHAGAYVVPGAGHGMSGTGTIAHVMLPLMLGLNLSDGVSVIVTQGLSYYADSGGGLNRYWARLGLGFDFRFTKTFALHPEVTVLRPFHDNAYTFTFFGLGFQFGGLPSFEDLR